MNMIKWEVRYPSPPEVLRRCKRCGRTTSYRSSGLFRVNAQQKVLDVWLIYHCTQCNATWNMAVLSRVSRRRIPPQTLKQYMENDPDMATACAMDLRLLPQNEAQAQPAPREIHGEAPPLPPPTPVCIAIKNQYDIPVKVSQILREKLGLSRNALKGLAEKGQVYMRDGSDVLKCRLRDEAEVMLVPE